ncbi:MAG: mechanosensitive ion channel, partial [Gammaproteobacteria bacterium]|nr:mechanosensitive ion channel [Gammaproteobacteria bacterium]
QVLEKIRRLIDEHEFVDEKNSRVRFLEFGEYAQELELYIYIKTIDFAEYLEHCEDINLRLSDIVESSGAHLTVPVKSISIDQKSELPST